MQGPDSTKHSLLTTSRTPESGKEDFYIKTHSLPFPGTFGTQDNRHLSSITVERVSPFFCRFNFLIY